MKKLNISIVGILFVVVALLTIACKKDKDGSNKLSKPSDQQGTSAADGGIDDVNDFINNKIGGGSNHKSSAYNLPCGVVYMDSSGTNSYGKKVYAMHYGSQTPCGYSNKSGVISFALISGTAFNSAGALFKISFINYVIEALATGETVTINGYVTIKNVNGGYIWEAVTLASVISHQVRGNFDVTYSDGTVRNKQYFQLRTYNSPTSDWAGLNLSVDGDTVIGSKTIYEIGKTYDGNYDYKTEMINGFVWANCGATYAGPYVLKTAHARMNVTVPSVSPAYIDIEGGYHCDALNPSSTATLVNDCTTNAYKITTVIATAVTTQYQLY